LAVLTDIAVSLKTNDREWLQINRETAMATFYASPDPMGWFLAFDPDHDRHPIPFSPTLCQCLHVGRDCQGATGHCSGTPHSCGSGPA
jgi:hypothetical protein